jgi:hypothetical protein
VKNRKNRKKQKKTEKNRKKQKKQKTKNRETPCFLFALSVRALFFISKFEIKN